MTQLGWRDLDQYLSLQMTSANNAVGSGEFDVEEFISARPRACSTLLLFGGSSVNNLQSLVR